MLQPCAQRALLQPLGSPVSLVLRVLCIGRAERHGAGVGYRLTLEDAQGDEVAALPLGDPALLDLARGALRGGERVLARGAFVEAPGPRGRAGLALQMTGLDRLRTVSPLLCPTPKEEAETAALLGRLGEAELQPFLLASLRRLLCVSEASLSPRFRLAEQAVLYLALSSGQVQARTNPRLSLLLCSRPGLGKKLLCEASLLLCPLGAVVQAGMATPAGLSASVTQSAARGLHAAPGLLARSDEGVVVIEDMHRFEPERLLSLRDVLCSVLEDGRLIASKAARADFQARTALQVSVNRRSDLRGARRPRTAGERLQDLHLSLDLATRFDLWIDLDVGDDAAASARAMLAGPAPPPPEEAARRGRELKLLCAALRDRLPEVDLRAVAADLGRCVDEAGAVLGEAGGELQVESVLRRLSNTLKKSVAAEARLRQRAQAEPADVARAFALVQLKVRALLGLCRDEGEPRAPWAQLVQEARDAAARRRRLLVERFHGAAVGVEEAASALGLTADAAERCLVACGRALPDGRYEIGEAGMDEAEAKLGRPPGSPQPARGLAHAARLLLHTPTLCAVLRAEVQEDAANDVRFHLCGRAGAALELLQAGWHPALERTAAAPEAGAGTCGPMTEAAVAGPAPLCLCVTEPDRRDLRALCAALYRRRERGAAPRLHLVLFSSDVDSALDELEALGMRAGGAYDVARLAEPRPASAAPPPDLLPAVTPA